MEEIDRPVPKSNEMLIRVHAAALNRRDVWICAGKYSKIQYPAILGSDGSGIVEGVGSSDLSHWIGKEVVFNPSMNWGDNPKAQGKEYQILGMPTQGTLAEYITLPAHNIALTPSHLTNEQAAAFPLAFLTAYRAVVTQAQVSDGDTVLITGIGGGVALACFQIAKAIGANVYVTTGSDDKLMKAAELGAKGGANYHTSDWGSILQFASGGFDAIIDSAGGSDFNILLGIAKAGGTIASYGATMGTVPEFNLHRLFWKQLRIIGATMGTDKDFAKMLEFVSHHKIIPVIDSVFSFEEAGAAFDKMNESGQFGKIVVKIEGN
ncbi:MAG: zinc-binding dehydrogenase [Ignavibacteriae bacterium]|nr:zinc-binding dehydrogenase [Ignavibacteriota bacterium]